MPFDKKANVYNLSAKRKHCLSCLHAGSRMVDSHTVEVIVVMGFVTSNVCPLKIKQRANDSWADLCPKGVNYHQWTLSPAATHSLLSSIELRLPNYVDL